MWQMIRKCAVGAVLLSACCGAGADQAVADDHGQFEEIVIELKFPASNGEGAGTGDASSSAKSGENEADKGGSGGFRGFKLEINIPDPKSDEISNGEASKGSGKGTSSSDKTGTEGDAGSGNTSSPKGNERGQNGKASPAQKKTQKDKSKGSQGINLGNPQEDAEKRLGEIQKKADGELGRANEMLEESLKSLGKIRGIRRKGSQSSNSPPCTSTSGNVGITHEFIDGIKECKCDGEICRWK